MTLAHAPENKAPVGPGWALCMSDSGHRGWLDCGYLPVMETSATSDQKMRTPLQLFIVGDMFPFPQGAKE